MTNYVKIISGLSMWPFREIYRYHPHDGIKYCNL